VSFSRASKPGRRQLVSIEDIMRWPLFGPFYYNGKALTPYFLLGQMSEVIFFSFSPWWFWRDRSVSAAGNNLGNS